MKICNFSVKNYRSITSAKKISMNNMTVLVGKNNEGKSNILRALALAMDILKHYSRNPRSLVFSKYGVIDYYNWEKDYPISLQTKHPNGYSVIELTFELLDSEVNDIRKITNIKLNNFIPIRISINDITIKIDIPKQGSKNINSKIKQKNVIDYICDRVDFVFIQPVRTEKDILNIIETLIENQLKVLDSNSDYNDAIATISKLQQDVLDNLSTKLIKPMSLFIPSFKNIKINISNEKRRNTLRRNTEVIIDDGTATPIQQKGDGIKNLLALGLFNIGNDDNRVSIIAIEEPESHLHPESARQLYKTISDLSQMNQIILTTHSPLFINRNNLNENIIVDSGTAKPVKRIKDIRDILGIKVSDNLTNAENILLVEGEEDKKVLEKLLPDLSVLIKKALDDGTLLIDYIGGTGNLTYKLSFYRNIQCKYHVLLDNDDAGRKAEETAEKQALLTMNDVTFTFCKGSPNAEIEDCFEKNVYKNEILNKFGVNLDCKEFRNNKKWSDRVAGCFNSQGKQWNSIIEGKVKTVVADSLPNNADIALNKNKRSSIDSLVVAVEKLIRNN